MTYYFSSFEYCLIVHLYLFCDNIAYMNVSVLLSFVVMMIELFPDPPHSS